MGLICTPCTWHGVSHLARAPDTGPQWQHNPVWLEPQSAPSTPCPGDPGPVARCRLVLPIVWNVIKMESDSYVNFLLQRAEAHSSTHLHSLATLMEDASPEQGVNELPRSPSCLLLTFPTLLPKGSCSSGFCHHWLLWPVFTERNRVV